MADVNIGNTKVFTIPANTETRIIFPRGIQHITVRNISLSNKIFLRYDGADAAIDNAECFFIDAVIAGLELYSAFAFESVSFITATEQDIMIINAY